MKPNNDLKWKIDVGLRELSPTDLTQASSFK